LGLGSGCVPPACPHKASSPSLFLGFVQGKPWHTDQKAVMMSSGWWTYLWEWGLNNSVYIHCDAHTQKREDPALNKDIFIYCIPWNRRVRNMEKGWESWDCLALRRLREIW